MIKYGKKLGKRRIFSEEFKKARIKEYEQGKLTVIEISSLYNVCFQTIYNWIYKYSTYNKKGLQVVEMKASSQQKIKELKNQIKELERVVGQKQLNIDYLEKMMEIAKDELNIDIKKNFGTPQSTGSLKTDKKQRLA